MDECHNLSSSSALRALVTILCLRLERCKLGLEGNLTQETRKHSGSKNTSCWAHGTHGYHAKYLKYSKNQRYKRGSKHQHKPNISNDHQSVPGAGGATCIGWPISGKFKVNNGKVTSAPRKTKSGLWKASKAVRSFCTRQPWKILQCVIFTFPIHILSTNQTPEMRFPTYTAKLFCMIGGQHNVQV